jgi:CRISPR-associated exonuclease Cas4
MFTDDALLPLSALQHYLFCPRQAALIHLEQAWADNRFTAEGNALHNKAHDGHDESRPGVRITRSLPIVSRRLGIAGQCDIVEFHADGTVSRWNTSAANRRRTTPTARSFAPRRSVWRRCWASTSRKDSCSTGSESAGRTVEFGAALRELVETTAHGLHEMIASRVTPAAEYDPRRCDSCSLIELCQPKASASSAGRRPGLQMQSRRITRPLHGRIGGMKAPPNLRPSACIGG